MLPRRGFRLPQRSHPDKNRETLWKIRETLDITGKFWGGSFYSCIRACFPPKIVIIRKWQKNDQYHKLSYIELARYNFVLIRTFFELMNYMVGGYELTCQNIMLSSIFIYCKTVIEVVVIFFSDYILKNLKIWKSRNLVHAK